MKNSKNRGISFIYIKNGKKMHCGVTSQEEYDMLGKSPNPLAPTLMDSIYGVFLLGKEMKECEKMTVAELKNYLEKRNVSFNERHMSLT